MKTVSLALGVALVSSVAGCGIFSPHESVILGVTEIAAPASIPASAQLSVVLTVGTGGCTSFERIEMRRTATEANVTAWGRRPTGRNVMCPADFRHEQHTVRFDPPYGSTFDIVASQPEELPPLVRRVEIE